MRTPEFMFRPSNAVMRLLLCSPLHAFMSGSILLIHYTGRKSGGQYVTPVRYARIDGRLRCTTSEEIQWWRNVWANPDVMLRLAGETGPYRATVVQDDPARIRQLLTGCFAIFPQNAAWQNARLQAEGSPNPADLAAAARRAVVVEFEQR